jgi:uncharacterized membrane protein
MMFFLLLMSCGGDKTSEYIDRDTAVLPFETECDVDWDAWANGFFTTYCKSCHSVNSTNRYGAPESVNIDTVADVRDWADRVRLRVLESQTMPVGGGVPEEELLRLSNWMDCLEGTP